MSDKYKAGDYYVTSDRTGRKILASEARREWTGSLVHKDEFETRHQQDFVRGLVDDQTVPISRPKPVDTFIGPLVTYVATAAVAGATTLVVDSTTNFTATDKLNIMLANGDMHRATVSSVTNSTTLELTAALPWSVDVDAAVINVSEVTASTLP